MKSNFQLPLLTTVLLLQSSCFFVNSLAIILVLSLLPIDSLLALVPNSLALHLPPKNSIS